MPGTFNMKFLRANGLIERSIIIPKIIPLDEEHSYFPSPCKVRIQLKPYISIPTIIKLRTSDSDARGLLIHGDFWIMKPRLEEVSVSLFSTPKATKITRARRVVILFFFLPLYHLLGLGVKEFISFLSGRKSGRIKSGL
jgi:hypothetical protein